MKQALFLIAAACALSSCCREVVHCDEGRLAIGFVGFTSDELDSVVINRFEAGTDFGDRIASDTLLARNAYFTDGGDTLTPGFHDMWVMRHGSDYEIIVLSTGRTSRVSAITLEGRESTTMRCDWWGGHHEMCVNGVASFNQDGVTRTIAQPVFEGPMAVLLK